ncbi:MAG: AI-2E family transporter [Prevotella sp.]|nr:AI-2E family transporter [Candidatus Equicola stercoris]
MKTVHTPITFDSFARLIIIVSSAIAAIALINYLSSVLLPFFIAWLIAYLLYPIVTFIQHKLHVRFRFLSILLTLAFVLAIITGILYLIIPSMIEEMTRLKDIMLNYIFSYNQEVGSISAIIHEWFVENLTEDNLYRYLANGEITQVIEKVAPSLFSFISETFSVLFSIIASCIAILYLFFILSDYEELSEKWVKLIPHSKRKFATELASDVKNAMSNYFRGQCLVSLIMGILFAIGFSIIGFPMAIGLAVLIGIMNLVPYLHSLALIPTVFLSLLNAAETGKNFWVIFLSALAVFIIVQIIIDLIVTPRIMSKAMNLKPAIILLSLSVCGMIMGFIGLIIALPLTTICISYYKRYVVKEIE